MADQAWMKIRKAVLDKAEYYRSIGKDKEWQQLETHVKAMDYGLDGWGVPYKKLSKSQLNKLMDANPEPEKLPKASLDMKRGAIDVGSSKPKKSLKIAERLRQNLKKVAESDAKALREMDQILKEVAEITGSKPPPAIDVKATSKKLKKNQTVEKAGALVAQPPSTPVVKGGAIVPSPGGALANIPGLPAGKSRKDILKQKLRIGAKRGLRGAKRAGRAIGAWDGTFTDRLTMGSNDPGYDKHGVKINDNSVVTKRKKALPAGISPMPSTSMGSDDDWEGEVDDNRKDVLLDRKIDILRKDIARDPSIPFPKDTTPWYDDVTGLMKSRDQAIEDEARGDETINPEVIPTGSSAGQNAIPTPDGKKKRKKTRGKGPVKGGKGFGSSIPKGKGTKSPLHNIAKNISETRKALFGLFKVQKDRFKLRKGIDKKLDTKVGAQKAEDRVEKDPDAPDDENKNDGRYKKPKESSFDKAVKGGLFSGLFVAAMPLVVEGLRPFFEEQADTLEKIAPEEDEDTKEDEIAVAEAEQATKEEAKEEKESNVAPPAGPPEPKLNRETGDPGPRTAPKRRRDPQTTPTPVSSSMKETLKMGEGPSKEFTDKTRSTQIKKLLFLQKRTKDPAAKASYQQQIDDLKAGGDGRTNITSAGGFAEGGKITPTKTGTPNLKKTDGIQKPLQQLSKKDLQGKGQRALNKFVEPIKNVFQLPNIVVSRSLGLGKKALSATSKIAGAAFKMTPFGMAKGLTRGMRGKSGKDGKSWEEYKNSRRYQQRQERIEALRNDPTATRTMTVNGKEVAPKAMDSMLALKDKRVNKLRAKRDFANPLGGLMKNAKERGVGGVLGGVADAFTGNMFDFDGKNVKPGMKASKEVDKGESQSDKMVKVISTLNSVSNRISVVKQQNSTQRINIPVQTTSKMSQSAIDAALQPGL